VSTLRENVTRQPLDVPSGSASLLCPSTLNETGVKPTVRSTELRREAPADRVRESVLARVVRSSQQGLSYAVLDLRVEGGGE